jgi:hypothetical protein
LIPNQLKNLLDAIDRHVRDSVEREWHHKKNAAHQWKREEDNKTFQARIQAEQEKHQQEVLREREEHRLQLEEMANKQREIEARHKAELEARENERKQTRPATFTEWKQGKGRAPDPVGQHVRIHPGQKAGLTYKVEASSATDFRLQLVSPSGLRVRKFEVSIRKTNPPGKVGSPIKELGNIEFYLDGDTMGIVFRSSVTLVSGQAIYIDLPEGIDFANLDGCPYYQVLLCENLPRWAVLRETGTHTRGPRVQSRDD